MEPGGLAASQNKNPTLPCMRTRLPFFFSVFRFWNWNLLHIFFFLLLFYMLFFCVWIVHRLVLRWNGCYVARGWSCHLQYYIQIHVTVLTGSWLRTRKTCLVNCNLAGRLDRSECSPWTGCVLQTRKLHLTFRIRRCERGQEVTRCRWKRQTRCF